MTTYEPADWRPEPGDVAEVTRNGEKARRVLTDTGAWWSRDGWILNSAVEHVRRLLVVDPASTVILDPNNPDDVERLAEAIKANPIGAWPSVAEAALRSLLPTPPLPEPNGLGAVAKVAQHANRLYYDGRAWHFEGSPSRDAIWRDYTEVATVLSHGVGCTCGAPDCNGGDQ